MSSLIREIPYRQLRARPVEPCLRCKGRREGSDEKVGIKPISVGRSATMLGHTVVVEAADDRTSGPVPKGLHPCSNSPPNSCEILTIPTTC